MSEQRVTIDAPAEQAQRPVGWRNLWYVTREYRTIPHKIVREGSLVYSTVLYSSWKAARDGACEQLQQKEKLNGLLIYADFAEWLGAFEVTE